MKNQIKELIAKAISAMVIFGIIWLLSITLPLAALILIACILLFIIA